MIKFPQKHFNNTLSALKLLPNFLTLMALTVGLNSLKLALEGKWEKAVICIIIAAVIDGLDGRLARLFNATSVFGAELDSLCDFVNFGICPVLIIYLWLSPLLNPSLLWTSTVIYAICMVIRLARFNTDLAKPSDRMSKLFFTGVPAPCGAMLSLLPMILSFDIVHDFGIKFEKYLVIIPFYVIGVGFLLASRLPTFGLKHIHIKKEYVWIVMLVFGMVIIESLLYPWYAIPVLSLIYLISIVVSYIYAQKVRAQMNLSE
jgi:CDP-diacylglycerol--serine O-phosphatidyltransferase